VPALDRPEARADPGLFIEALISAEIAAEQCDLAAARQLAERALEFARQLGDDRLLSESLSTLFFAYYWSGEPGRGFPYIEESVQRARELGDDVVLGRSLMGYLLSSHSIDPSRCERLYPEAIACTERSGDRFMSYCLHNNAGCHAMDVGDVPAARAHLEQAAQAGQAVGNDSHHVPVNLGWVLRLEGDPDGARSMFEAGLRISRRSGNWSGLAYACSGLACLAVNLGDWHRAAVLHGAAQALLDRTGEGWEQSETHRRQDSLDQVRAHLGQEQFDRVYANGTTLSLEQALDTALAEHWLCAGCDR
jgi:tetratricopeptide (TPR) repeat protein